MIRRTSLPLIAGVFLLLLVSRSSGRLDVEQLKGKPIFAAVEIVARQHPEVVRPMLEGIVKLIPDETQRKFQMEQVNLIFGPGTMAMDGPCTICKVVLGLLRVALTVMDYDRLERNLIEYCELLFISLDQLKSAKEMCQVVKIQGPHVAKLVMTSSILSISLEERCAFLNSCYETPQNVLLSPHGSTRKDTEPNASRSKLVRNKAERKRMLDARKLAGLKIAQLTDIHIEHDYKENTDEHCGHRYVCCVEKLGPGTAGHFGSYECNVPVHTMRLFMEKVKEIGPDHVIFSGDIPPHTVWEETLESQLACTETLTRVMNETISNIPIYPGIGNHEMYPTNLFSFSNLNETISMVDSFGKLWQNLAHFADEDIRTMNAGGYYSKTMEGQDDIRIISINTNYMYTNNIYNLLNHHMRGPLPDRFEATAAKTAIRAELALARGLGEKVIMINHHPPGGGDYLIQESKWYEALMVEYSDIVVLQVAGHTHTDEFRLLKDSSNEAQSMLYVSPSIDAHNWRNPSMRIYYLDETSFELLDYEQYYFNLSAVSGATPPEIVMLYSAAEEYELDDMTPSTWEDLLKRFETEQDTLLKHRGHSYANAGTPPTNCDENCRRRHVCRQMHAHYDHYEVCAADPPTAPPPTTTGVSATFPPLERPETSPGPSTPTTVIVYEINAARKMSAEMVSLIVVGLVVCLTSL